MQVAFFVVVLAVLRNDAVMLSAACRCDQRSLSLILRTYLIWGSAVAVE